MLRVLLRCSAGEIRQTVATPFSSVRFHFSTHSNRKYDNPKGVPTLRQKRIASEVRETICEALQQGPCQNPIFQRAGFEIRDVKMSSDLRTAHVLWRALPGMQKSAEKAVLSNAKRLRSLIFSRLSLPFSPMLKFQEDTPPAHVRALEEAFAKLRETEGESQAKESSARPEDMPQAFGLADDHSEVSHVLEEDSPRTAS